MDSPTQLDCGKGSKSHSTPGSSSLRILVSFVDMVRARERSCFGGLKSTRGRRRGSRLLYIDVQILVTGMVNRELWTC